MLTRRVRFLTVDALFDPDTGFDSSPFYQRLGFLFADPADNGRSNGYRSMFLDLKSLDE